MASDASEGKGFGLVPAIAVAVTILLNIGTGVWFASGINQRVGAVETRQLDFARDVGRLDQAREQTNIHMTQLDAQFKSVDDKLGAILTILQQDQAPPPQEPSGVAAPQQNFTKPPSHR